MAVAASPQGLSARELSEIVGASMPTTYHLVQTLCAVGFLRRNATRRTYVIGLRVGALADGLAHQLSVPEQLLACVRAAATATGEGAYGSGWLDDEIVVLSSVRGTHPIGVAETPLGLSVAAHARASGKLLLALAPAERRERYFAKHPQVEFTPNTFVGSALEAELADIAERGYAVDNEEHRLGVCCVAAPLQHGRSYVVAISAPADRFREEFETLLAGVQRSARLVGLD
jgi:IclR family transcriptional regulator, acetate operon repressor